MFLYELHELKAKAAAITQMAILKSFIGIMIRNEFAGYGGEAGSMRLSNGTNKDSA